jgi:protoheme IX farnesyltransferase
MGDYGKAGIPMLPNVAGRQVTRLHILIYAALLVPIAISPTLLGSAGWVYFAGALILSLILLGLSLQLYLRDDDRRARMLFGLSIAYLFLVFGLLLLDGRSGATFVWSLSHVG